MKRTLPLTLLLCIAAAVAAGPASAAQGVKQAKFKASISSNQVTTWAYDTPAEAPCVGAVHAAGSVQMPYRSRQPVKLWAIQVPKSNPLWEISHGDPFFSPTIPVSASAEMEGERSAQGPPMPEQCDANGGGVVPQPQDCGLVVGFLDVKLRYILDDEILVTGDSRGWGDTAVSTGTGDELRNAFQNCPYWEGGPYDDSEAQGDLLYTQEKLPEKDLFNAKRKKFVIDGSQRECFDDSGITA